MIPKIEDAKHALQLLSFNLTGKGKHPHFRRFGFIEKAEYWALVWGTIVMSITGILLAFENLAAGYFSKEILDILLIVHYYEAWLAAMAIVIWHMYFAVLRPTVYPMNPAWITGSMPRKMYEEEHPADHVALGTGSDHEATTGKASAAETKTSSDSQTEKSDK
jgi:cytochrome b subunit of formate dehydrogenase